ncbi:hypothetical protein O181_127125, partial [Austropuccinia psidii MF-1]|nr:hypothetical protein [Austropuccinia psidii MF-1]
MVPCNHFPIQPCGTLQECALLRIPSYPSPLERQRNIWPIMGWREVIKATAHIAPGCATRGHNCLTQIASCRHIFNGVRRHAPIQLPLVFMLWHQGSSRI